MTHLYVHKYINIFKTGVLFGVFLIFTVGIGWAFAAYFGNPNILLWAAGFSIFLSAASYWFSDKLALAMARARPVTEEKAPELYQLVKELVKEAGLPPPKIYIIDEPAPNAFATGRSPQKAVVALTSGLLERLNREELKGVLAHELSHIGNWDMLVSTVAVILVGFVSLLSDFFLRSMLWGGAHDNERGSRNVIVVIMVVIAAVLTPLAATLIQLAISRKRELLADASGALLTGNPEGLAGALQKISAYPRTLRSANNTTAHLWFANPFRGQRFYKLFLTHPPVEERIKALRAP